MKKIKAILFDLDGTLLPMDQESFLRAYFGGLCKTLAPRGYEPRALIDALWAGCAAMIKNDGSVANEKAYWKRFSDILGEDIENEKGVLEDFYAREFDEVRGVCGFDPDASLVVRTLKDKGYRTVLATNPVFPAVATRARMRWAGLCEEDFELYTTYENSSFAKPNPQYYRTILATLGLRPEECLMVGNDVDEDLVAAGSVGMRVFLIDKCLINKENKDISVYPRGDLRQLLDYVEQNEND